MRAFIGLLFLISVALIVKDYTGWLPSWKLPWDTRSMAEQTEMARNYEGEDRDCSDFDTQPAAQQFYDSQTPGDPHSLDEDGDGEACDHLPWFNWDYFWE